MVILTVVGEHHGALHRLGSITPRGMKEASVEKQRIPATKL
jgi:hypothetical protein